MINKDNVAKVIDENRRLLPEIKENISNLRSLGGSLAHLKPLEFIKNFLIEKANVILYPSKEKDYGGLVRYKNGRFYVHINTMQPKVYENFIWAHEFYHFYFEKEKIKNSEYNTFIDNGVLNEQERRPNLFASEILINEYILKEKFESLQKDFPNELLQMKVLRLIPTLELPYKVIVIKLAQDGLIDSKDAVDIIDFDYKNNIPDDFDLSYLKPSFVIKIDHVENLISDIEKNELLNEEDFNSFKKTFEQNLKIVSSLRERM